MSDAGTKPAEQIVGQRASDAQELGYRVTNPDAPPSEPRRLEPLDPVFQAKAERILLALRNKWLKEGT